MAAVEIKPIPEHAGLAVRNILPAGEIGIEYLLLHGILLTF